MNEELKAARRHALADAAAEIAKLERQFANSVYEVAYRASKEVLLTMIVADNSISEEDSA